MDSQDRAWESILFREMLEKERQEKEDAYKARKEEFEAYGGESDGGFHFGPFKIFTNGKERIFEKAKHDPKTRTFTFKNTGIFGDAHDVYSSADAREFKFRRKPRWWEG